MPHISSKQFKDGELTVLYQELSAALGRASKRSKTHSFLGNLFTKTEKIMLAKRFAVICMIAKGVPHSYIAAALGMSPATVARMSLLSEKGNYDTLLLVSKQEDIGEILEKILRAGLPPIRGRGRWKFLYE